MDPLTAPDPFTYLAVWGIPVKNRRGFDLMVARQILWLPHARPALRQMLFTDDAQPICPACSQVVATGSPSVVCVAVLADRELQDAVAQDPRVIVAKDPDADEAWWLVHGDCLDGLSKARAQQLNQRIELALRAETRVN